MTALVGLKAQFVVRCKGYETEGFASRAQAERRLTAIMREQRCPDSHHIVEQRRGPETMWQWKDVDASIDAPSEQAVQRDTVPVDQAFYDRMKAQFFGTQIDRSEGA